MVEQMEEEEFGGCTLHGECQEACPKEISIDNIVRMNRDYIKATLTFFRPAVAVSPCLTPGPWPLHPTAAAA
jgi:succinate dehydrogenase / fumarate reductase iron-sulfur subunit